MVLEPNTLYYLENPEEGIFRFATGTQLKYEDIVKEVFGVADLNDLKMMIAYNKSFQVSVCKANNITEDEITLNMIFRVATTEDKARANHLKNEMTL
ncbi:hypothetical protein [Metabacillus malikii]|uniref:Uncharacterized protein n=1 Tax=Metabacillus malikii TaxID=1504265 RepID=A0ABT9ZCD8_9BACI|nr:hypothetical protein [Metabacillus malikii]MDQ0229907.1 hypothetical protein [Metabacillus malikii]